jgi:uncharacterized protein
VHRLGKIQPDQGGCLLVVANSARMLAQAAHDEGYKVLVVDCFGDRDTLNYAQEMRKIADLSLHNLIPAVEYFLDRFPVAATVYGSGFEGYPESLAFLAAKSSVYGNKSCVLNRLQNKPEFFSILAKLNIPYPAVSFTAPEERAEWLLKPIQSLGGTGIKRYEGNETGKSGFYWQRYLEGVTHSVLFQANGHNFQTIGFNRQWHAQINSREEFIFAGIINHTDLSAAQQASVTDWLSLLVPEYRLKGLNSLDFMLSEGKLHVLEINPRPTAAMQLYNSSLFVRHLAACQDELLTLDAGSVDLGAYKILFSKEIIEIPSEMVWPEQAMDIPQNGAIIYPGQPICSMIVRGKEPEAILAALQSQEQALIHQLTG